ncbi:hypothetical protein BSNK01_21480 [Bacillaceae bacterium]
MKGMIVYTAVPLERVFEGIEQMQPMTEMQVDGLTMLVQHVGKNEMKIVRLISSNPHDYLNPKYAPGQKIYFRPELG